MEIEWSLTCQREDGFDGPKLTCPPLPPQQYAHRNQDSSFVSRSPSLSILSNRSYTIDAVQFDAVMVVVHARIVTFRFPRSSLAQWVHYIRSPRDAISRDSQRTAQRNEQSFPPLNFQGGSIDRIDRSIDQIRPDPIRSERSREISALRYRHEARQPRALSRSRSPCLIAIRSIASRSIALQTSIVSHDRCRACFPPLPEHQPFPGYVPGYVFRRLPFGQTWRGRRKIRFDESCRRASIIGSSIHGFLLLDLVR